MTTIHFLQIKNNLLARQRELREVQDYLQQHPTSYTALIRRNELIQIVDDHQRDLDNHTKQLNDNGNRR